LPLFHLTNLRNNKVLFKPQTFRLYTNIAQYNGKPHQLYVCGHSAGGHLAAMVMATNWPLVHSALQGNLIKGVCAISGLFNLLPVQLSYLNKVLNIDKGAAFINSPVYVEPSNSCPLIVAGDSGPC